MVVKVVGCTETKPVLLFGGADIERLSPNGSVGGGREGRQGCLSCVWGEGCHEFGWSGEEVLGEAEEEEVAEGFAENNPKGEDAQVNVEGAGYGR